MFTIQSEKEKWLQLALSNYLCSFFIENEFGFNFVEYERCVFRYKWQGDLYVLTNLGSDSMDEMFNFDLLNEEERRMTKKGCLILQILERISGKAEFLSFLSGLASFVQEENNQSCLSLKTFEDELLNKIHLRQIKDVYLK